MTAGAESMDRAAIAPRAGGRGAAVLPRRDREPLFAAAQRRSARVRVLRKAILIGAFGMVAGMIAIAVFNPFGPKSGSLGFSNLSVDGSKIEMAKPRLAGFRSDGQPYVLTADRALQDIKHPTIAELQNLVGDMGATGGETTRLTADVGVYDTVAERMRLTGAVKIANPRFLVRLRSVDIDFKTGVYRSDEPVELSIGDNTKVVADRAVAKDNGQELIFEGRVRTTIAPGGAPAQAQAKDSD